MTEKSKRGLLVVASGLSSAGKSVLIQRLLHQYPNYRLSVPVITRAPCVDGGDGKDYFFMSHERSEEMIAGHKLIEHVSYVGSYYGALRDYVEEMLTASNDMILEIEIQGVLKIKDIFPETVFVFVAPPDAETLEQYFTGCGMESRKQVLARLERAAGESCWMPDYDYPLVNNGLNETVARLRAFLESQHLSMRRHRVFAEEIRAALNRFYLKGEK